jgi:glycosyltransferase involved in cell wall biosynthesis
MMLPITSIIRQATRKPDEPYNILTAITHERYETQLCKTGHNFYAFQHESFKPYWNEKFSPIPDNYYVLRHGLLPDHVKFDFVLSHNKFGQYQVLSNIAQQLHLPLISLEHTLPFIEWDENMMINLRNMRGNVNVFISDYSIGEWGWQEKNDTRIIHHGLDTDEFSPGNEERQPHILSVVNDWVNRDWCCGFYSWKRITKDLPVKVLGDTKGLSFPAKSTADLIQHYRSSQIFLNTSTISPVPMALMEAMACGCAVVSTATCMIPEIIQNGVNGLISNDEAQLRSHIETLLNDENLRRTLGENARATIVERFGLDSFVDKWNTVFDLVADTPYRG